LAQAPKGGPISRSPAPLKGRTAERHGGCGAAVLGPRQGGVMPWRDWHFDALNGHESYIGELDSAFRAEQLW